MSSPSYGGNGQNFTGDDLGDLIKFLQKVKEEVDAPEVRYFKALRTLYMLGDSNEAQFIQGEEYEGVAFDEGGQVCSLRNELGQNHWVGPNGDWFNFFEEV
jgi:hypothetical protein